MAAISNDFVTKNGIVIEGNSAVTSSTNQSNALQAAGGAAIAKNLIVGTTATVFGDTMLMSSLSVSGTISPAGSIIPVGSGVSLGSESNPFADLYIRGNSLYIERVKLSATGTSVTFFSTLGSTLINAGALALSTTTNSTSTTSNNCRRRRNCS